MTITNFSTLKDAILEMNHNGDSLPHLPLFIKLAEKKIDSSRLRLRQNEQRATANIGTDDRFLSLPDNFLQARRVSLISGASVYELQYLAPEQMTVINSPGRPRAYTVTSEIEFDRVPDTDYVCEYSYYSTLIPLNDANPTNDVLTAHPDIYLYACLAEYHRWARDENAANYYDGVFDSLVDLAVKLAKSGRYGPAPVMRSEGSKP